MMRISPTRLGGALSVTCARLSPHCPSTFTDPYRVLGLSPAASFEDVRSRFHELTRQYHPDMPAGDPNKFREINAAYRQIRADYRQQTASFANTAFGRAKQAKSSPQSSNEFWATQNEKVKEAHDRMAAARRRAAEQEAYARRQAQEREKGVVQQVLDRLYKAEVWLSLATVAVVFVYAIERYFTMRKSLAEKEAYLHRINHGLPPMIPMELDETMKQKYSDPIAQEEVDKANMKVRKELLHRKATQRRFEDFREFLYIYDPDGVADRRVTTERFSFQYVDEAEIANRCPVVKNCNPELSINGYEYAQKDLVAAIEQVKWESPDMGYAAALVAKGLACIPANSPNTSKWTFIEYRDTAAVKNQRRGRGKAEPVCLVAIRNHRFTRVGMCQRVTITGRPGLVSALEAEREEQLKSGAIKPKELARGGPLPIRDLSVSLKDMKL